MEEKKEPVYRDIRRYYCKFCGICRSKKSLLASHLLSQHEQEVKAEEAKGNDEASKSPRDCKECGASFRKPAHLKQHMQSHDLENSKCLRLHCMDQYQDGGPPVKIHQAKASVTHKRPFACPMDDCNSSYRRNDHLNRHLLGHQGKVFTCPIENCNSRFVFHGNMTRHVKELHDEESSPGGPKLHICQENGCGKAFKYASQLKKHEDSHVDIDSTEALCSEPGCMKYFSNVECLKAHIRTCHRYVPCEVCGTQQLKKNLKRHLRSHEEKGASGSGRINCSFSGCQSTFSTMSNLKQHVKSIHLELRPFACRVSGCGKKFTFKHVRDNHEKSGVHIYLNGDFLETDERSRSRPRGGCKRKSVTVETLQRKRVVPLDHDSVLDDGCEYLRWVLSSEE